MSYLNYITFTLTTTTAGTSDNITHDPIILCPNALQTNNLIKSHNHFWRSSCVCIPSKWNAYIVQFIKSLETWTESVKSCHTMKLCMSTHVVVNCCHCQLNDELEACSPIQPKQTY